MLPRKDVRKLSLSFQDIHMFAPPWLFVVQERRLLDLNNQMFHVLMIQEPTEKHKACQWLFFLFDGSFKCYNGWEGIVEIIFDLTIRSFW